jgi:predicted ATPase
VNTRPAESQAPPPLRLPVYATPFSGRSAELAQIVALLSGSDCRLLTLTGPGGMGKTRLAIEAARRLFPQFPFGVYFVPLAALTTSIELINAIAEALNFRFTTASKPERQLAAYLAARKGLIVLDNMEHLLTSAPLLVNLLAQAPDLRFLVTSQERLALSGEWVFEISGLPYPGDQT